MRLAAVCYRPTECCNVCSLHVNWHGARSCNGSRRQEPRSHGKCDTRPISPAFEHLKIDVAVGVAHIKGESLVGSEDEREAVATIMFRGVYQGHVVAVLQDIQGGVETDPAGRSISSLKSVPLLLARVNSRVDGIRPEKICVQTQSES